MDEIEEIPYNLCGVIAGRYVIKGPVDDPVGKGFLQYHIHDDDLGADKTAVHFIHLYSLISVLPRFDSLPA